jgi:hypothetical protein
VPALTKTSAPISRSIWARSRRPSLRGICLHAASTGMCRWFETGGLVGRSQELTFKLDAGIGVVCVHTTTPKDTSLFTWAHDDLYTSSKSSIAALDLYIWHTDLYTSSSCAPAARPA